MYIFEASKVNAVNADSPQSKLRLLCREEVKGNISAIAAINGYLVVAYGQKVC